MKKIIFSLLFFSLLFIFTGCSSSDNSSSIKGTKWSKYTPEVVYTANWVVPAYYTFVEFTSETDVTMYDGSENGSPSGTIYNGKYVVIGNKITVTGLTYNSWFLTDATINGNALSMNGVVSGVTGNYSETFMKQ